MNFAGFDLNQLRALHALLEEAHVARAAQRLGITAPAASNALRRLRMLFDDPLLVRSGSAMIRSPLAERLQGPLARLMADTEQLLRSVAPFEPASYRGAFHLATSDHVDSVLLGAMDVALRTDCPRASLRVHRVPRDLVGWLEGEGDLVIGAIEPSSPALHHELLFEDRFVCLMRADHRLAGVPWTPEDYAALDHVLITPRGLDSTGVVDDALAEIDLCRRVAVTVTNFWVAPALIAGSDRVVTLPIRYARTRLDVDHLVARAPPISLPPIAIAMVWHARVAEDSRHRWLRARAQAIAQALPPVPELVE